MNLQVLISTMNQKDHYLLEEMNIQSDAIIINQSNTNDFEEFEFRNNNIKLYSFKERGIGLSRNNALMRATTDIGLFADDDVIYNENYKKIIIDTFEKNPDADVIIFNVPSLNPEINFKDIKKVHRVRLYNCLKYGAVRIAVKIESVRRANIYFSLLYGGGAKYSAGEDSLFLIEAIKKGLKVYATPQKIGEVKQESSTWFKGYNDKYFIDKGTWLANAFPVMKYPLAMYYSYMMKELSDKSMISLHKLMKLGITRFSEVVKNNE